MSVDETSAVVRMKQYLASYLLLTIILRGRNVVSLQDFKDAELMEEWTSYKETYGKNYTLEAEYERRAIWKENYLKVVKHNDEAALGLHNYTLRINHLADMGVIEYVKKMIKLLKSLRKVSSQNMLGLPHHDPSEIPEELDWREKGYNTPVRNQESCGACYAFAIGSMVEAQYLKKKGHLKILSVQQMVDCSTTTGNMGCNGGSFRNTLSYIQKEGLVEDSVYPYTAKVSKCKYNKNHKVTHTRIKTWTVLPPKDEYALKVAVAVIGPIAVAINASPSTFQLYHNGVYDDIACSSDTINHAMLLIGYTKTTWILKNWWSTTWGQNGYMHLRRNRNQCGVANFAAYGLL
ncbi:cathepsin K-like [Lycorma delicatula]|uniref:cathepsin K-like n=1 Tax=Lycorma delicatula TaxID=130591 RepID=UPI003F50D6C5